MNLERALKTEGWMEPDELAWLAEQASKAAITIEVGSYKGRSTRAICDNTKGTVFSVDPYGGPYYSHNGTKLWQCDDNTANEFAMNLADHIVSERLVRYRMTFPEFARGFDDQPDFIFLDGDHRADFVREDILTALKYAPCLLSGHDYGREDWPDVKAVVDEFFPNVNVYNSIWWSYLDAHVR